ncbi:MAG: EAL and HDOD domain-containing protein [Acidimicrobiia bacterium]
MNLTATTETRTRKVLLARQPIFDTSRRVVAYELLQRVDEGEQWHPDDDVVTLQVIRKAVMDFGLDQLLGGSDLFLNVGAGCFAEQHYAVFPPERTVLEVLERVTVDDVLIGHVEAARAAGYRIALDDYIGDPAFDPLLALADIIKMDVQAVSPEEFDRIVRLLGERAPRALLLAEKVESEQQLLAMAHAPISLFQGYYFKKPVVLERPAAISNNQAVLLQLAASLHADDVAFDRLTVLISGVADLAFQVLRLANSAALGPPRRLTSLHEAVINLGLGRLRRIVYILLATQDSGGPAELGTLGLVRGRFCAQLAAFEHGDEEAAFTVGLLSLMDVALRRPMEELLEQLQLGDEIGGAILRREGPLGRYLAIAEAFEREDAPPLPIRGVSAEQYLEAVAWANSITRELAQP